MRKFIIWIIAITLNSSFIHSQELVEVTELNYYSNPANWIPENLRVSDRRYFRIDAQAEFLNCKTDMASSCFVSYLDTSTNTWVRLDGMWYYLVGNQIPKFKFSVDGTTFWDASSLPIGLSSKTKTCSYPYKITESYGTAKIIVYPIFDATIYTKILNPITGPNAEKYINSAKFTDGDVIYFQIIQNGDNCTISSVKEKIGSNTQSYTLSSIDGLKYKTINLPSNSPTSNVTYYFQGSSSFNIENVSVTVYPKPLLQIAPIQYSCNNQISHIKFKLTAIPTGKVQVSLHTIMSDGRIEDVGTEKIYTSANLNQNISISTFSSTSIYAGNYRLAIRNVLSNSDGTTYTSGHSTYDFSIAPPPSFVLGGDQTLSVRCSETLTNITISPGTDAQNSGLTIQYGIVEENELNPGGLTKGSMGLGVGESISWQDTPTFNDLAVGTHKFYCRYVINNIGLCISDPKTVNITSTYNAPISIINLFPSTYGICNGTDVNFTISATYDPTHTGDVFYQYKESTGSTYRDLSSLRKLPEGTYDFQGYYTSNKYCPGTPKRVTLTNSYTQMSISTNPSANINYCTNNEDGQVGVTFTGGMSPFDYKTFKSGSTTALEPLDDEILRTYTNNRINSTGNYYIRIDDANGCNLETSPQTIGINNEFRLAAVPSGSTNVTLCNANNDGSYTINFSGGTGLNDYTASLYKTGTTIPLSGISVTKNSSSCVFRNLGTGSYYATLTMNSADCDISTSSRPTTISLVNSLTISASAGNVQGCAANQNGSVAVTLSVAGSFLCELYNADNNTLLSSQFSVNGRCTFSSLPLGNYKVKANNELGSACPVESSVVTVGFSNQFTVGTPVSTAVRDCYNLSNGSLLVRPGGFSQGDINYALVWGTGSKSGRLPADGIIPGLPKMTAATLTISDQNCTATRSVDVSGPEKITFQPVDDIMLACYGRTTQLKFTDVKGGSGTYSYSIEGTSGPWYDASTSIAPVGKSTKYLVVADRNLKTCQSDVDMVIIDEPVVLNCSNYLKNQTNGYEIACNGGTGSFTWSGISGGNAGEKYIVRVSPKDSVKASDPSRSGIGQGTFDFYVSDSKGCKSSVTQLTFNQPGQLQINSLDTNGVSCIEEIDGEISFNITGGVTPYTINDKNLSVTGNDLTLSSDGAVFISNRAKGDHKITILDKNGCSLEKSPVIIAVKPVFKVSSSPINIKCSGETGGVRFTSAYKSIVNFNYTIDGNTTSGNNLFTKSGLTSGDHTYNVQPVGSACTKGGNFNIKSNGPITLDLPETVVNCTTQISNDGIISFVPKGGSKNFSIQLSGPVNKSLSNIKESNTVTFSPLKPGNYTTSITDDSICTYSFESEIKIPDSILTITVDSNRCVPVKCHGQSSGEIKVIAEGGWHDYRYDISGPGTNLTNQTNSKFTGLPSGTYTIVVKDLLGATASVTHEITQPAYPLSYNVSNITPVDCFGNSSGSFNISASGGTAGFQYQFENGEWNYLDGTVIFSSLAAATYSFVLKDTNGCLVSGSQVITQPTAPLQGLYQKNDYNGYAIRCNGLTDALKVWATGGTAPYEIWVNQKDQVTSNSESKAIFNDLPGGNYPILITDSKQCEYLDTAELNQPAQVLAFIQKEFTEPVCFNDANATVTLQGSGGAELFDYKFEIQGIDPLNLSINQQYEGKPAYFNQLLAGNYQISVTDVNQCSGSDAIEITQPMPVEVNIVAKTDIKCYGDSTGEIQINISGGRSPYRYRLNSGSILAAAPQLTLTDLKAGTHVIEVFDQSGCSTSVSQILTQPSEINTQVRLNTYNDKNIRCYAMSDTVFITSTGGIAPYNLSFSQTNLPFDSDIILPDIIAGQYQAVVTDSYQCHDIIDFELTQPDSLKVSNLQISDALCFGQNSGSVDITTSGGIHSGSFIYQLQNSETHNLINSITGNFSATQSNLYAGNYLLNISDANGCSLDTIFKLDEPGLLQIQSSSMDVTCKGDVNGEAAVVITHGTQPYQLTWTDAESNIISNADRITNIGPGSYKVEVEDANHCKQPGIDQFPTATVLIREPETALSLDLTQANNPLCFNDANGEIQVSTLGGWGQYQFTLNGFSMDNTGIFENLSAGNYKIHMRDSLGCSDSLEVTLIQNQPVIFSSIVKNDVNCFDGDNGQIVFDATGGTGIYNFSTDGINWNNENTLRNLTAGNYDFYVRDQNFCMNDTVVIVNQPDEIDLDVLQIVNSISCQATGIIEIAATGGTAPYSYLWDENARNQTGNLADNLAPGLYYVTITDHNNCTRALFAGTVSRNDAPQISLLEKKPATCRSTADGKLSIYVDFDGTAQIEWWRTVGNQFTGITGPEAPGLLPGIYTAKIQTEGICYSYYTDTVKAPDPLNAFLSASPVLCKGLATGKVNLDIEGGLLPYSIQWFNSSGNMISTQKTVEGLSAGWYRVLINDQSSCAGTKPYIIKDSVKITEPAVKLDLTVPVVNNNSCSGFSNGNVKLQALGGTPAWQYAVNGQPFSAFQWITGLSAGDYLFYVKDANGCSDSVMTSITEPQTLVAEIASISDVKCFSHNDGSVTVSATGGTLPYQYKLSSQSNYSSSGQYLSMLAGNYSVEVKDAFQCKDSLRFMVNQPDRLSVLSDSVKDAWCGNANGEIMLEVSGGTKPYRVNWNDPDHQTGIHITGLAEGTYISKITDKNNCLLAKSYSIRSLPGPEIGVINTLPATCHNKADGQVSLKIKNGFGIHNFNWFGIPHTDNLNSVSLSKGFYKVAVTDAHQCTDSVHFTITAPQPVTVKSQTIKQPLCFNDHTGSISVVAMGGTSPYTYQWTGENSGQQISGLGAGNYTVTVTDAHQCTTEKSFGLQYPAKLAISRVTKKESWCSQPNGYIEVSPSGGTSSYKYLWAAQPSLNAARINQLLVGNYQLKLSDVNNCFLDTTITLGNISGPDLSVKNMQPAKCSYNSDGAVELTVNAGTAPFIYTWNNNKTTSKPADNGYKKGNYKVVVKDAHNCYDTLLFSISAADSLFFTAIQKTDPSCFGFSNGLIEIRGFGGTLPYSYQWSNGQLTNPAINLKAGGYTVSLTDANKCLNKASYTLKNPVPLVVDIMDEANICSNQSIDLDAQNPGLFYHWYSSNGFESYNRQVTLNQAGQYFIEVLNANNCLAKDSIRLNVSEQEIEANFLLQSEAWVGDTLVMIEISWPVPESIEWDCPAGLYILREEGPELEFIALQQGYFDIGLTTYNDICTETTSKTLQVHPANQKPAETKSGDSKIIKQVTVNPVPSNGPFNVDIELNETHEVTIEIMHVSGALQFTRKINGDKHYILNFSNATLAQGIHTITVRAGNEQVVKKLIIIN